MSVYNIKCKKCNFIEKDKIFPSFNSLQNFKCPKCNSKIEQTYDYNTLNFKINGYCYSNHYKGKSMYRDIIKKREKEAKAALDKK